MGKNDERFEAFMASERGERIYLPGEDRPVYANEFLTHLEETRLRVRASKDALRKGWEEIWDTNRDLLELFNEFWANFFGEPKETSYNIIKEKRRIFIEEVYGKPTPEEL